MRLRAAISTLKCTMLALCRLVLTPNTTIKYSKIPQLVEIWNITWQVWYDVKWQSRDRVVWKPYTSLKDGLPYTCNTCESIALSQFCFASESQRCRCCSILCRLSWSLVKKAATGPALPRYFDHHSSSPCPPLCIAILRNLQSFLLSILSCSSFSISLCSSLHSPSPCVHRRFYSLSICSS